MHDKMSAPYLDPNCFETPMVFLFEYFEEKYETKLGRDKKACTTTQIANSY